MAPARLVLLHGFLATSRAWEAVARDLSSEVEVLAPDLPGHGSARDAAPLSLESAVEHVAPMVRAAPGPVALAGHSMGAIVALALADACPENVAALGLVSLPVFRSRRDALSYLDRRGSFHHFVLRHDMLAHAGCVAIRTTAPTWTRIAARVPHEQPPNLMRSWFDHSKDAHDAGLAAIAFAGRVPLLAGAVAVPVAATHSPRDNVAPFVRAHAVAAAHGWDFERAPGKHQLPATHPGYLAAWLRARLLRG